MDAKYRAVDAADDRDPVGADDDVVKLGAANEIRGAERVAAFSRRARGAPRRRGRGGLDAGRAPRVVYQFTTSENRITAIDLIADPTASVGSTSSSSTTREYPRKAGAPQA